jgi:hypothetical protein
MNEKYAEFLYNKILKKIVYPMVSNKTTYLTELKDAGIKLLGSKFKGVYASDRIPILDNNEYSIINVDKSGMNGSHWLSIAKYNNKIYLYDSFGRDDEKILPSLKKSKNGLVVDTDADVEQKITQLDCGARCLAWLVLFEYFGYDYAILI